MDMAVIDVYKRILVASWMGDGEKGSNFSGSSSIVSGLRPMARSIEFHGSSSILTKKFRSLLQ